MSVSIRLARAGSKKRPFYRIVAAEKSFPRDGRFIEQLGFYDPRRKVFEMKRDRYTHWVGVGAQPTDTMRTLAKKFKTAEAKTDAKTDAKTGAKTATKTAAKTATKTA